VVPHVGVTLVDEVGSSETGVDLFVGVSVHCFNRFLSCRTLRRSGCVGWVLWRWESGTPWDFVGIGKWDGHGIFCRPQPRSEEYTVARYLVVVLCNWKIV
jgi:hypothetical protein